MVHYNSDDLQFDDDSETTTTDSDDEEIPKSNFRLHDAKNPDDDHYLLRMPTKIPSQKLIERRQRAQLQRKQREDAKKGGEEEEKVVIHLQKQIALQDLIYLRHFNKFKEVLNIDLTSFKFLSDQGPALISVFTELNIKHMFCLRHLLVSLKKNKYSYAIKIIINYCSKQELHNCLMFYSDVFSYDIDPAEIKQRNKLLKKVVLISEKKLILTENDDIWEKVSMIERVQQQMP